MSRFFIETAKCDVTTGGIACGPVGGEVVASVRFSDGSVTQWISLVEVDGIPNFYLTDKDIFEDLLDCDFEDQEFADYLNDHFLDDFNGITFTGEYEDIFISLSEDSDNPAVPLIRYLIALVRCEMDEVEELIDLATGRYVDELDIPISDLEEEYLEEYEDGDYARCEICEARVPEDELTWWGDCRICPDCLDERVPSFDEEENEAETTEAYEEMLERVLGLQTKHLRVGENLLTYDAGDETAQVYSVTVTVDENGVITNVSRMTCEIQLSESTTSSDWRPYPIDGEDYDWIIDEMLEDYLVDTDDE